jgi:hypothetical protein
MRPLVTLVMVAALPIIGAAQLPRDLGGLARQVPSLDSWLRGAPLSTSFDDTARQLPVLDRKETRRQARSLRSLPRTASGGFELQPGLWADTFESYCLRTATHAPGKGDGYLLAPIKGARSAAIQAILAGTVKHPEIPRGDVQMLLWAILSRVRVSDMQPRLQAAARALLPPGEVRAINANGLDVLAAAERTKLAGLAAPVRQVLEVESDLRYQFSRADVTYAEIERIAVLSGARPPDNRNAIKRGQWSRDPRGYFIRFFPDSFSNTRVEVLVPGRVTVTRDRLNRIIALEDARGGRTETVYNDAVPPRTHPRDSRLKAYAFKTIRFIRRGTGGKPEVHEIHDQGWTFHRSRPRNRGVAAAPVMGFVHAAFRLPGRAFEILQGGFGDWAERAEQAQDIHDRYDFYRERADRATDAPSEDAVDELEDTDHYRDGIDAATSGDPSDRLEWIIDHHERETGALEWAISVLEGLPTTSTTDDPPAWEPGGGVAVPSRGGQTLGISGR